MKEVWVICSKTSVCQGHGSYSDEFTLATVSAYGGPLLPAYESEESAFKAIKEHKFFCAVPVRLDVRGNE